MGDPGEKKGPSKLASDLILGADGDLLETELVSASDPVAQVPLDPAAFAVPPPREATPEPDPTIRIPDPSEAPAPPPAPPPAAFPAAPPAPPMATAPPPVADPADAVPEAPPVPEPRPRTVSATGHPWHVTGSATPLPPEAPEQPGARAMRRTPLPTGLDPEGDFAGLEQHGIQALPIEDDVAVAPRAPKLPCSLLVAAPEQRTASKRASALMEQGYMCRVVSTEGLTVAAAEQPYDAIVIELPAAVAQRDGGTSVIGTLGAVSAPVIVTCQIKRSPVSVESRAHVAAWLEEPFEPNALVVAIEEAREMTAEREDALHDAADGMFDLSVNLVRTQIVSEEGVSRGRVRAMSYAGKLTVDMREGLPVGTRLTARFRTVEDRREAECPGQVVDTRGSTSTIKLEIPETATETIRVFVDEARNVTTPTVEQVVIRARVPQTAPAPSTAALMEHWLRVKDDLDDDKAQQAFIKSCLETKQIEFAVRCYRELKEVNPEDERIQKYLNQVGTILGFYAFRKDPAAAQDSGKMPMILKVGLGLFITLALTLWVLVELLA